MDDKTGSAVIEKLHSAIYHNVSDTNTPTGAGDVWRPCMRLSVRLHVYLLNECRYFNETAWSQLIISKY